MRLAEQAIAADPRSAAAALAASIAAQASFDIRRARELAEKAAELDPEGSVALSRAAELRMGEGDLRGARQSAEEAVKRNPDEARALAVLGFVELAQFRSKEAESLFERAVAADSGLALAHLGLGISRIRKGRVEEGRGELQIATALDPADSLLRSYLGKSYYEERRSPEAGKELEAAKELDPSDPTPYLYDAIRKQNDNRPLEALADLRQAIARNDNRAVYRSRLLLDQDAAVRATDLARIYNDLGFEQLGMVSARRSADEDHANYSSHLFLAGNYRNAPFFAPAFLSEVLQARIYQPANVNAVRPDSVNGSVSFNEYTALFDRPRARAFADLRYGQTDESLSELIPASAICVDSLGNPISCRDATQVDRSRALDGSVTGTLNGDRYAAALSYRSLDDDGFRQNADERNSTYRGFFEYSPTYRDSFQFNAISGRRVTGDLPLRQSLLLINPERLTTDETNFALGYHRIVSPSSQIAVSAIHNDTQQMGSVPGFGVTGTITLKGPQLEYQQVLRTDKVSWIFGAGGFDGSVDLESAFGDFSGDDSFVNGYAYAKLRNLGRLEITAGAAVEHVEAPLGLLPPRDSNIFPADVQFTETRVSPKIGLAYYFKSKTTLRLAGYERLSPFVGRVQTLEPTQVAGFNQLFEETGGSRARSYGAGVDHEFGSRLFGGISYLRRDLTIPEGACDFEDPFSGCGFQSATHIEERESRDEYWNAYLSAPLGKRLAAGVEYLRDERDFDFTHISPLGLFQDFIRTERIRPQIRLYLPSGFFAGLSGTRYDQEVHQFDDLTTSTRMVVDAHFWIEDLQIGYRLPKRYGSVILEARNLTDREFPFFERTLQETVVPARAVSLRALFTY